MTTHVYICQDCGGQWEEPIDQNCSRCQVAALKTLIREMAKKMDYCADWFASPGHGHQIADEIRLILNRPEVVAIMKEGE